MTETELALEYFSLVVEAMDFTDSVDEALLAADMAMGPSFGISDDWPVGECRQGPSGRWFVRLRDGKTAPCTPPPGTHSDHRWPGLIPGGLAEGKADADFDPEELESGTEVEMEHTGDPEVAREIASDHLAEFPNYYRVLKVFEKLLKDGDADAACREVHALFGGGAAFGTWQKGDQVGTGEGGKPIYRWTDPNTGQTRDQNIPPGTRGKGQEKLAQPRTARQPEAPRAKPAAQKPATKPVRGQAKDVGEVAQRLKAAIAKGLTDDDLKGIADELMTMRVVDINEVKKQLGLKASGNKAELAKKIARRAKEESDKTLHQPPEKQEYQRQQKSTPSPYMPVKDLLDAYKDGDAKVKALSSLGSQIDHWDAEEERIRGEVDKLYEKMGKLKSGKLGKIDSANLKRLRDASGQAMMNKRAAEDEVRETLAKKFAARNPVRINPNVIDDPHRPFGTFTKVAIADAQKFLSALVDRGGGPVNVETNIKGLPPGENRAYYLPGVLKAMMIKPEFEDAGTVVHEWGHNLEEVVPGVESACQEFLKYRLKGEKPQKLKSLFPQSGYKDHEEGAKDEFDKAFGQSGYYVGKIYKEGHTEILSMGLEKLYNDPTGFARKDPEYCKFILGILDGSTRRV